MAIKQDYAFEHIAALQNRRLNDSEPDWLSGDIDNYPVDYAPLTDKTQPVQQSDLLKPLLLDIANYGLNYVYHKYQESVKQTLGQQEKREDPFETYQKTKTKNPKKVVIVGAGIGGLLAAYELAQVGHTVQIVEMQQRVGGRIKTFGEKEGFDKHLYVDGGAMRLPCRPKAPNKTHFLTDYYAGKQHFDLPMVPFRNSDKDAFLLFYNMTPMTQREWEKNPEENFDKYWNGWDHRIQKTGQRDIKDIGTYYSKSVEVVTTRLRVKLASATTSKEAADVWDEWIADWSQFPLNGYLRSTAASISLALREHPLSEDEMITLQKYIPWPEAAITAYSTYNYTVELDTSLVQILRGELGEWWSDNMHHIDGGMSRLPEKFTEPNKAGWNPDVHLQENIMFNFTVNDIEFTACEGKENEVLVSGYFTSSGEKRSVKGNAVIITTPLHIIREMKIHAKKEPQPKDTKSKHDHCETEDLPNEFYMAIMDIWYAPSTKIMIQSRKRFWEKKQATGERITGGFSKTSLPIGQVHYPTSQDHSKSEKGILLCYTWKSEALLFGALKPQVAIRQAVRQIARIHPEIEDEFEVGAVQAWYNDPSSQGAFVLLKPHQYRHVQYLMTYPWKNVYFAGEGISFASGWIQGAMESALRAAFQFYIRNEKAMQAQPLLTSVE